MEGDRKRTPGQVLDEALNDDRAEYVKIIITYKKHKTESPKPAKPRK